ncbi:hypothetical protein [Brevibacillus reuszeri]|uniref:hypothetical protein n=1 Tax=Brevibacillus reuszeri TaxID=54915 RepID=UPI003D229794
MDRGELIFIAFGIAFLILGKIHEKNPHMNLQLLIYGISYFIFFMTIYDFFDFLSGLYTAKLLVVGKYVIIVCGIVATLTKASLMLSAQSSKEHVEHQSNLAFFYTVGLYLTFQGLKTLIWG